MKKFLTRRIVFAVFTVAMVVAISASAFFLRSGATHASPASGTSGTTLQDVHAAGTGSFSANDNGALTGDTTNQALAPDKNDDRQSNAVNNAAPTTNPNPAPNPVTPSSASGFQGLNHFDQRTRDGGNAFSLEPPDQGLCVGNGYVLEAVNDVMVVFDKNGNRLNVPTSMNTFFGLPFAINRTTGVRGDFLSDPKCLYDAGTGRFFLTVLQIDPGASIRAHTLIAVSKTSDPRGQWYLYSIDATDDGLNGTPDNGAACHPFGCFGDQPLIGANDDGFFITTNEFGELSGFNGAQIYAMPKAALAAGTLPKVVHINAGLIATPDAGGIWYSVQPATSPAGGGQGQIKNTEFFMSALQFGPAPLDNRIAVWSLENTSALVSGNPMAVKLSNTVIASETYGGTTFAVSQKAGDYPLGQFFGAAENHLNANDDRMNQVVYANGMLWSGVNTVVNTSGSRYGFAYFIVSPTLTGHGLSASVVNQGYVTVANNNTMFPSIGVNAAGKGAIGFTVSGPDYYPSAGYALIDATNGAGAVHISGAGVGPADGFTGYPQEGGNGVERWGDYSAAVADADGSIWMANEYIAQTCTEAQWRADSTCGGTRTQLANWSTFVANVQP